MRYVKFGDKYVIRVDRGEEVVETLRNFCGAHGIKAGVITGLGATNKAIVGLFETAAKIYHSTELSGDYEIVQLNGNVSTLDGAPYVHIHAVLSDSRFLCYGGHLNSAIVSATCECTLTAIDGEVPRSFSDEIGLNLYDLR
ncbi:MAG: DNA-binding protein [Nitrospirae bacterium]|nr:DNA-binding protein [Nitrospirota bacterium]